MKWKSLTKGFRVALPEGWEDRSVYSFQGPETGGNIPLINLTIDENPSEASVADYGRIQVDALLETIPEAEILLEQTRTLKNKREIFELVFKWVPIDETVVFIKSLFFLHGARAYCVSGHFSKQGYKTLGQLVDTVCAELEAMDERGAVS